MDSQTQKHRICIRNAFVCFICTAVCIVIDVRHYKDLGYFTFTWQFGISILIYIGLIVWGIYNIRKAKSMKKFH